MDVATGGSGVSVEARAISVAGDACPLQLVKSSITIHPTTPTGFFITDLLFSIVDLFTIVSAGKSPGLYASLAISPFFRYGLVKAR
jgi:hypothetical protein